MAFEKLTNNLRELKLDIDALKTSSAEYYKLKLYKKAVKATITIITLVFVSFTGIFALLFLSIALAVLISNALDSPSAGFFIVAAFYLLLIVLYFVFGKKLITKKILTKSSKKAFNE